MVLRESESKDVTIYASVADSIYWCGDNSSGGISCELSHGGITITGNMAGYYTAFVVTVGVNNNTNYYDSFEILVIVNS